MITLRNNKTVNCGTGYKLSGDVQADLDGNEAINCGRGYDFDEVAPSTPEIAQKEPTQRQRRLWSGWTPPIATGLVVTVAGGAILHFFGWT